MSNKSLQDFVDEIAAAIGQRWVPNIEGRELRLSVQTMAYHDEITSIVLSFVGTPPRFLCFIPTANAVGPFIVNGKEVRSTSKRVKVIRLILLMLHAAGHSEVVSKIVGHDLD